MPKIYTKAPASNSFGGLVQLGRVVITSPQPSVEFINIPPDFSDLQVKLVTRGTGATAIEATVLRFNNDSVANHYSAVQYYYKQANNSVGSGNTYGSTLLFAGDTTGGTVPANYTSGYTIDIPNYSGTTFYKSFLSSGVTYKDWGGGRTLIYTTGGYWLSTAAINRITIWMGSNYAVGSVISLYGLGRSVSSKDKF